MKNYFNSLANLFNFNKKISLKVFWIFFGVMMILNIIMRSLYMREIITIEIYNVYTILILLTFISFGFRRLKDAGFSGFLFLIPILNLILAGFPSKKQV
ncbi:DUF805 domain-containing protein [Frigoriflavimonas asaccharolytica]|uniref:Uncharacterized membrane protein YhaH (DUF805 family) n=1 Tax=Frigoriflavimonas asaccharolytica TaxID=2735899 RepID=A0A8J8K9X0_9FLAO|nr:uncharacterized membrane protein YhaH (DUF805 family) [Frigoriflavimonas asaccharolytica]